MEKITAEIRIEVLGQNDLVAVQMWRTADGGVIVPPVGAHIIHKSLSYGIIDVTWNYDQNSIIAYARIVD